MKKFLMEGIGTFILVIMITLVHKNNAGEFPPLAYGSALAALWYIGGQFSGAQYNPAISLAALMQGKLERWDFPYYVLAQIAGGVLAAVLAAFLIRSSGEADLVLRKYDTISALFAEAIGAFLLTMIYLGISVWPSEKTQGFAGLAVGLAAAAGVYAFSGITIAAFNPVIVLGMAINGISAWGDVWVSLGGTMIGAAAGASLSKVFQEPKSME
ncbi:MAG: aquaporin [Lewinellaceae bacterium]|nr:aquaporin [Saprospiraceae bacterium]MCB9316411.1 aquaporin [Lewinellaceae bacterium]MCB9330310.1 aquaporin [Lewinellaceae bacterium]